MITIKKIVKEDNFLSLSGNVATALFGFAGFALLARDFSKDLFGQWILFISFGSFTEMFRFGITNTAVVRYLSGAGGEERQKLIGSNALIGLVATILIGAVLVICNLAFHGPILKAGYGLFFTWYPILALLNLPLNTALVILQADRKFGLIFLIKGINSGLFFLVVLVNFLFMEMTLVQLVWAMLAINALTSLISILSGWDGLRNIRRATGESNRILLNFGKYTTLTLIGTNLLRSADTLIISLSPLGTAAVALYSIPLRLTEVQQIPLRSFVATAFPKMSKASISGKVDDVKKLFYSYSGAISYLFVIVSLVAFVFADFFVLVLGGREYLGVDPVTGFNTAEIVRILAVYGLLLPIDRMTGIGLDSINRPALNTVKVIIMLISNVIGDIIALFVFKSLVLVAVGSILFTILGIWVGFHFLGRELSLNFWHIFSEGIEFYRSMWTKVRGGQSPNGVK